MKKYKEAEKCLIEAIGLDPNDCSAIMANMAKLYENWNDDDCNPDNYDWDDDLPAQQPNNNDEDWDDDTNRVPIQISQQKTPVILKNYSNKQPRINYDINYFIKYKHVIL